MRQYVNGNWVATDGPYAKTGFIPIPLTALREIISNDIPTRSDTELTDIATKGTGVLSKTSTPQFEYVNGDTDSAMRLEWASSNGDPVAFNTPLPPDVDTSSAIELHVVAAMGGATDTPVFDLDTFFNVADTKVSDATAAVTGTTVAEYTATIAAADIPTLPWVVNIEMTPGAHTTDALYLYAVWLEYTKI